jgi:hypothetical protein
MVMTCWRHSVKLGAVFANRRNVLADCNLIIAGNRHQKVMWRISGYLSLYPNWKRMIRLCMKFQV